MKKTLTFPAMLAGPTAFAQDPPQAENTWFVSGDAALRAASARTQNTNRALNVVPLIPDGNSVGTNHASRLFAGRQEGGLAGEYVQPHEAFPNLALVKTYNVNAQTPDSAGTGTAMMSALKTKAGIIDIAMGAGPCRGGRGGHHGKARHTRAFGMPDPWQGGQDPAKEIRMRPVTRRTLLLSATSAPAAPRLLRAQDADAPLQLRDLHDRDRSFSDLARSLEGRRVWVESYMAPSPKADATFFVLTKMPMAVCPVCETEAEWPEDILAVYTRRRLRVIPFSRGIEASGVLELGACRDEATGFPSTVRLADARHG